MVDERGSARSSVAVIVADLGNPFYVDLARGISQRLDQDGYLCLIGDCGDSEERQQALAETFMSSGVSALIVTTPHSAEVMGLDIPVVAVDRPRVEAPYVAVDNVLGGRLASQHLVRCGYQRIGILYADAHLAPVADRLEGFRDGLTRHARTADAQLEVACASLHYDDAYDGAMQLLESGADAVFAISDVMATGVLAAATERGLGVPDGVGIVGYDDTPMAAWPTVNLTSVAQNTIALGAEAAGLALRRIISPRRMLPPMILPPRLTIRGSTRAA